LFVELQVAKLTQTSNQQEAQIRHLEARLSALQTELDHSRVSETELLKSNKLLHDENAQLQGTVRQQKEDLGKLEQFRYAHLMWNFSSMRCVTAPSLQRRWRSPVLASNRKLCINTTRLQRPAMFAVQAQAPASRCIVPPSRPRIARLWAARRPWRLRPLSRKQCCSL
jgi:hypothetical protein